MGIPFMVPFLLKNIATIAIPFAIAGIVLYRWAARRRAKGWMIAGGLIGGAASLVTLATAAAGVAFYYYWHVPSDDPTAAEAYRNELGFEAGPEVTQIYSDIAIEKDSYQHVLRFHAPPETIATLIRGRFVLQDADACRQRARQVQRPPEWWSPSPAPGVECYVAEPFGSLYAWNAAWILYNRSTGHAHFHYLALRHPS